MKPSRRRISRKIPSSKLIFVIKTVFLGQVATCGIIFISLFIIAFFYSSLYEILATTCHLPQKKKTLTGKERAFLWAKNIQYLKHGRQLLWEPRFVGNGKGGLLCDT